MVGIGKAHEVGETEIGTVPVAHIAPQVVRACSAEDGSGTVLPFDPFHLAGHDIRD